MKILLDTSFLLPTVGVEVDKTSGYFEKVRNHEIYYSNFSILECLWIISSLMKKEDPKVDLNLVKAGIRSITESGRYKRAKEDSEIFIEALKLYHLGHRDMIDCLLYATALKNGLKFLSLDQNLKKFVAEAGIEDVFAKKL